MNIRGHFFAAHASMAVLLLTGVGCGGVDEIGSTLPVSGKVLVDKSVPTAGMVTFVPFESKGNKLKAAAVGAIVQGAYTLTTQSATGSRSGVPAGWYKVTVTTKMPPGADSPPGPASVRGPLIANRYTTLATTPLVVEVKEGGSYDLNVTSR